MKHTLFVCILALLCTGLSLPMVSLATSTPPTAVEAAETVTTTGIASAEQTDDPFYLSYISNMLSLGTNSPIEIVTSLIQIALSFLGIVCLVMILWSGVQFLFSMGQEDRMKRARHTFVQAIVGVLIIMLSLALVTFLIDALSTATGADTTL